MTKPASTSEPQSVSYLFVVGAAGAVNVVPAPVMLEPTAGAPGAPDAGDVEADGLGLELGLELGAALVGAADELAAEDGTGARLGGATVGFDDELHADRATTGTANNSAPLRIVNMPAFCPL